MRGATVVAALFWGILHSVTQQELQAPPGLQRALRLSWAGLMAPAAAWLCQSSPGQHGLPTPELGRLTASASGEAKPGARVVVLPQAVQVGRVWLEDSFPNTSCLSRPGEKGNSQPQLILCNQTDGHFDHIYFQTSFTGVM